MKQDDIAKRLDRIESLLINIHEIVQERIVKDTSKEDMEAYMNALKDKHRFTKKFPWNQTSE